MAPREPDKRSRHRSSGRSRGTWPSGVAVAVLAFLLSACADSSTEITAAEEDSALGQSTTSAVSSPSRPHRPIEAAYRSSSDPSHLSVRVSCAVVPAGTGDVLEVVETDQTVALSLLLEPVEPPCLTALIDVALGAPLAERDLLDGDTGDPIPVQDAIPVDPSRTVAAECTSEAARRAVELGVDGGLRSELRACDRTWMAVATSSNACAPTGEEQDPEGCIANQHTGYWRNVDGAWVLLAFDDCEMIRRQYQDFSEANCAG